MENEEYTAFNIFEIFKACNDNEKKSEEYKSHREHEFFPRTLCWTSSESGVQSWNLNFSE